LPRSTSPSRSVCTSTNAATAAAAHRVVTPRPFAVPFHSCAISPARLRSTSSSSVHARFRSAGPLGALRFLPFPTVSLIDTPRTCPTQWPLGIRSPCTLLAASSGAPSLLLAPPSPALLRLAFPRVSTPSLLRRPHHRARCSLSSFVVGACPVRVAALHPVHAASCGLSLACPPPRFAPRSPRALRHRTSPPLAVRHRHCLRSIPAATPSLLRQRRLLLLLLAAPLVRALRRAPPPRRRPRPCRRASAHRRRPPRPLSQGASVSSRRVFSPRGPTGGVDPQPP